jgi:5,10-methenyltetrahydrofolate synthetase
VPPPTATQQPSAAPTPGSEAWRRALRASTVAAREAVDAATRDAWAARLDAHLDALLARLAPRCVGACWPWKAEYDQRPLCARLRAEGIATALPVVVAPRTPLAFRAWDESSRLVPDRYGIPYPEQGDDVHPDVLLVPMNAFDAAGFRLGYGGGFFDRTLAARKPRPLAVGVAFELARVPTLYPRPHDLAMDWVVTERGAFPTPR